MVMNSCNKSYLDDRFVPGREKIGALSTSTFLPKWEADSNCHAGPISHDVAIPPINPPS